jgi:hypothetical protein
MKYDPYIKLRATICHGSPVFGRDFLGKPSYQLSWLTKDFKTSFEAAVPSDKPIDRLWSAW